MNIEYFCKICGLTYREGEELKHPNEEHSFVIEDGGVLVPLGSKNVRFTKDEDFGKIW